MVIVQATGGSMGPRYVMWLILVKNHKIANSATTTKARKKCTDMESLDFRMFFDIRSAKIENNQILCNKISHRLNWQPSYLLGERSSLTPQPEPPWSWLKNINQRGTF